MIYEKVLKILIMSVPKTGGLWSHRLVVDRKTIRILCSVEGILNSEQRHRLKKKYIQLQRPLYLQEPAIILS